MTNNPNQPQPHDVVLSSQNSPPVSNVILGGVEGVKQRFSRGNVEQRIAALRDALNYGKPGLDLVIEALNDESGRVVQAAFWLLGSNSTPSKVEQTLKNYLPLFSDIQVNYSQLSDLS